MHPLPCPRPRRTPRWLWTAAIGGVLVAAGGVLLEGELSLPRTGRPARAVAANILIIACGVGLLAAAVAGPGPAPRRAAGERVFDAGVGAVLLAACGAAAVWRFPKLTPNVYAAAVVAVWAAFLAWGLLYLCSALRDGRSPRPGGPDSPNPR
jgi:hypothetical protein